MEFIEDGFSNIIDQNIEKDIQEEKNKIIIHIAGEINNPGIVILNENARIIDAIEAAGGITENADLSKVNLAYVVSDGQKINIPNKSDKEDVQIITENAGINVDNDNIKNSIYVNINTATIGELQKLPGVGEAMAQRIINYRNQNGKFTKIEDIKNVSRNWRCKV